MEFDRNGIIGVGVIAAVAILPTTYANNPDRVYREVYPSQKYIDSQRALESRFKEPTAPLETPVKSNKVKVSPDDFGADMRFIGVPGASQEKIEVEMLEDGAYVFKANSPPKDNWEHDPILSNNYGIVREGDTYVRKSDALVNTMQELRRNHLE